MEGTKNAQMCLSLVTITEQALSELTGACEISHTDMLIAGEKRFDVVCDASLGQTSAGNAFPPQPAFVTWPGTHFPMLNGSLAHMAIRWKGQHAFCSCKGLDNQRVQIQFSLPACSPCAVATVCRRFRRFTERCCCKCNLWFAFPQGGFTRPHRRVYVHRNSLTATYSPVSLSAEVLPALV